MSVHGTQPTFSCCRGQVRLPAHCRRSGRNVRCAPIQSAPISVSPKYLERYAKEFEFRFNRRMRPETMLSELLSRFPELDA